MRASPPDGALSTPLPPGAPPPPVGRRRWQFWLGIVISIAFLIVAFRGQNPREVWQALRAVDVRWLAPALALFAVGVWLRALRWSVLLRPLARLGPGTVLPVVLAGYTANNILPLRTGEVVRAYLLGSRAPVRPGAALGSIAVERLCDGVTMLAFLLVATRAISPTGELRRLATIAAVLFAVAITTLLALLRFDRARDRIIHAVLRPLPAALGPRLEGAAESFFAGLGALTRGRDLLLVGVTSAAAWSCEAGMYWAIGQGFGPPLRDVLTPAAAVLTTAVANLATLVPAAPGYVGTFEAGVMLVVQGVLGAPAGLALSYALLVHAALWFPVTVVGAVCWWRLVRSGRRSEASPTAETTDPTAHERDRLVPTGSSARERGDRR
ncbi:MAG: flippase-like domain-containing protein [Thermomicrobiales bacterium]|nr:flippase-like domain-containing protein [Thermomicrobiales bacterium]